MNRPYHKDAGLWHGVALHSSNNQTTVPFFYPHPQNRYRDMKTIVSFNGGGYVWIKWFPFLAFKVR